MTTRAKVSNLATWSFKNVASATWHKNHRVATLWKGETPSELVWIFCDLLGLVHTGNENVSGVRIRIVRNLLFQSESKNRYGITMVSSTKLEVQGSECFLFLPFFLRFRFWFRTENMADFRHFEQKRGFHFYFHRIDSHWVRRTPWFPFCRQCEQGLTIYFPEHLSAILIYPLACRRMVTCDFCCRHTGDMTTTNTACASKNRLCNCGKPY